MKTNSPKKIKITLQDVLEVTQKGFERIEQTMATKEGLKQLEVCLDSRIDNLEVRIDKVESKIDGFSNRVERVEDDMLK